MALLTINGTDFKVQLNGRGFDEIVVGDMQRAFDGTLLSTKRGHKKEFDLETYPATTAERTTYLGILQTGSQLTVTGDIGTLTCHVDQISDQLVSAGTSGNRWVVRFRLREV